jgi:hypothetical protein
VVEAKKAAEPLSAADRAGSKLHSFVGRREQQEIIFPLMIALRVEMFDEFGEPAP